MNETLMMSIMSPLMKLVQIDRVYPGSRDTVPLTLSDTLKPFSFNHVTLNEIETMNTAVPLKTVTLLSIRRHTFGTVICGLVSS